MVKDIIAYVINLDHRTDRMESFRKNNFPFEVERVSAIQTDDGAIGCAKTHMSILEKQVDFPFIIFEDDCVMVQTWSLVEDAMNQLPFYWDMLWLGGTLDYPIPRYSKYLYWLKRAYCTHAIVYGSHKVVDYILKNYDYSVPIDVFYYQKVQPNFNCFITYPMTTMQLSDKSDIMGRDVDESDQIWRRNQYNKFTREKRS